MGLIEAGIGGLLGLAGTKSTNEANERIAEKNIAFQRETNAQNEMLMRESWGRDDNAVQRRTKDLVAAGMSPLLAAGSAAGNSGIVSMKAPESHQVVQQSGLAGAVSGIYQGLLAQQTQMDMLARQQQVLIAQGSLGIQAREQENRNKTADINNLIGLTGLKYEDLLKLGELAKLRADTEKSVAEKKRTEVETGGAATDAAQKAHDLSISTHWGLRKGDQPDLTLRKAEQLYESMRNNFSGFNFVGGMIDDVIRRRKGD